MSEPVPPPRLASGPPRDNRYHVPGREPAPTLEESLRLLTLEVAGLRRILSEQLETLNYILERQARDHEQQRVHAGARDLLREAMRELLIATTGEDHADETQELGRGTAGANGEEDPERQGSPQAPF